jgi:hypothetical protein
LCCGFRGFFPPPIESLISFPFFIALDVCDPTAIVHPHPPFQKKLEFAPLIQQLNLE